MSGFKAKMDQIQFRRAGAPPPPQTLLGEVTELRQTPIAGFKGPISKKRGKG